MGYHQTAHAGVGLHGTTLRETDADLFHVDEFVEHEIQAGVWQRRITHGRSDALELLDKHLRNCQLFVFSITPIFLSHLFMHPFCSSLSQPISQQLCHHLLVRIGVEISFEGHVCRGGEDAEFRGKRGYKVGKTKIRRFSLLLTQARYPKRGGNHNIITI